MSVLHREVKRWWVLDISQNLGVRLGGSGVGKPKQSEKEIFRGLLNAEASLCILEALAAITTILVSTSELLWAEVMSEEIVQLTIVRILRES
jgi:hypothetical protein